MFRVLLVGLLFTVSGCALTPMGRTNSIVVDGNSIQYVDAPGAGPTVVFESGLGDGLATWAEIYGEVREFAGAFAYSRPGYSAGLRRTDIGGARTADDAAKLLRDLLIDSGTPEPYVLVGHSIGGLYVLEFTRDYPELVAGLVLVDARLPEFTERCLAAGVMLCQPPAVAALLAPPHVGAEIRGIPASEADAPSPADIGDIPVILVAATRPPLGGSDEAQAVWLAVQREFAESLPKGRLVIADGSGHYIQREAPELVVNAIRRMTSTGETIE